MAASGWGVEGGGLSGKKTWQGARCVGRRACSTPSRLGSLQWPRDAASTAGYGGSNVVFAKDYQH